jgi:tRNA pseudouridine38-40 synthase
MRYKCTCAYDGRNFSGWQKQPTVRTVQGVIEEVLSKLFDSCIVIHGASRTDSGVHALAQVFHFDSDKEIPIGKLSMIVNRHLPDDVRIVNAEFVDDAFHSRFDTSFKTYEYKFSTDASFDVMHSHAIYQYGKEVDLETLSEVANLFIGTHDFKGLMASGSCIENTVRTMFDIKFSKSASTVTMRVSGSGFLYNMVRIMMGVYFDVAEGRKKLADIDSELISGNRNFFNRTAPACGLYLQEVSYEKFYKIIDF